ncbi:MAG: CNNM domain-containing protein [Planctomycetes bacterium]|nr:CNNM domain-containing protein [Planctomycetota bacterium]
MYEHLFLILNLVGVAAALLLSFISSGMETALYRFSRVRMRIRAEQGDGRAKMVLAMLGKLDAMVTTILIDNNIAAYLATYYVTAQLTLWRAPYQELISTALVTPLFFVFTESLPKQLAYAHADAMVTALVRVFTVFQVVFAPAVWVLNAASALLRKLLRSGGEAHIAHSQREILMEHFSAGVAENVLSEEQNRMARRIMQLEQIRAVDSMIPLQRLVKLPETASRRQAAARMAAGKTQVAILTDESGRPTGKVVTMGNLVMRGERDGGLDAASERLAFIRADLAIPEVLKIFRSRNARHALVVDNGRVTGQITTSTVLDKIAGISR